MVALALITSSPLPGMVAKADQEERTRLLPPGFSVPPGLEREQDDVDFSAARLRATSDNVMLSQQSLNQHHAMLVLAQHHAQAQQLLLRQLHVQDALCVSAKLAPSSDGRSTSGGSGEDMGLEASPSESASSSGELEAPEKTTVMMRNIPNSYSRSMLLELVDRQGFYGTYNLAYLPMDFATNASFGYGFLDFVSADAACRFRQRFHGFRQWDISSSKVCQVSWGSTHQGLEANIERYRNCPVMHASVSDEFKPAVFAAGERVAFPPPTKKLIAPKVIARSRRQ